MNNNEDINDDRVFAVSLLDSAAGNQSAESMITDAQIERYELPLGTARTVSTVLTVMMTVLFAWAFVAPIDVVAKAPGQLRPYGKPKLVQSELDGKVALIAVREGTHVKKNDMLVELDATVRRDDYEQKQLAVQQEKIKLQQMLAASVALNSIVKTPSVLPVLENDIGNLAQTVNDVYSAQKLLSQASYDAAGSAGGNGVKGVTSGAGGSSAGSTVPGEMVDLKDMLVQTSNEKSRKEEQIALLRAQFQKEEAQKLAKISSLQEQIDTQSQILLELVQAQNISGEQEADYAKVLDIGVSQVQFLDAKHKVEEANKQLLDEKATINNLKNELEFAKLELPRWRLQSDNEILGLDSDINKLTGNLRDVQIRMRGDDKSLLQAQSTFNVAMARARAALVTENAQIASEQESLKQLEAAAESSRHVLGETVICAPMDGIVTGLAVRAPGEVVTQGEQLMQVLPENGDLVFEASVNNTDIGFVRKGQNVKVKLDAFPYQDFGVLQGTVREIAQYPDTDKSKGDVYLVRITPQQMVINSHGRVIPLPVGLTAECDIILRKVTVMQALLRPLSGLNYLNVKS